MLEVVSLRCATPRHAGSVRLQRRVSAASWGRSGDSSGGPMATTSPDTPVIDLTVNDPYGGQRLVYDTPLVSSVNATASAWRCARRSSNVATVNTESPSVQRVGDPI